MSKIHYILAFLVVLATSLSSCTKMEEIEPCHKVEDAQLRHMTTGDVDDHGGGDSAIDHGKRNRTGEERPDDGVDNVNDDDDTEDDNEIQSVGGQ